MRVILPPLPGTSTPAAFVRYVIRVDSARQRTHGWRARVHRGSTRGPMRQRLFSDHKHGGPLPARAAAEAWCLAEAARWAKGEPAVTLTGRRITGAVNP